MSGGISLERAEALNAAMFNLMMGREGLAMVEPEDIEILRGASLIELAQVASVINAAEDSQPPDADGSRTLQMTMDDRLVAAIYTFLHYAIPPARDPDRLDTTILSMIAGGHSWVLACGSRRVTP